MNTKETVQRIIVEDGMKQEFAQTLPSRVERYLKVKQPVMVPYTEFAPASAECALLFRDGHYYGCISLSQAVAEALARFLCLRNGWKPKKSFEENVDRLQVRRFISKEIKDKFLKIWQNRDDYHHLNPNIERDREKLETLAYEKVVLLKEIESELFQVSLAHGAIDPKNTKYWVLLDNDTIPESQEPK